MDNIVYPKLPDNLLNTGLKIEGLYYMCLYHNIHLLNTQRAMGSTKQIFNTFTCLCPLGETSQFCFVLSKDGVAPVEKMGCFEILSTASAILEKGGEGRRVLALDQSYII